MQLRKNSFVTWGALGLISLASSFHAAIADVVTPASAPPSHTKTSADPAAGIRSDEANNPRPPKNNKNRDDVIEEKFSKSLDSYLKAQNELESELWRYKDSLDLARSGNPKDKEPDKTDEMASKRDEAKKDLEEVFATLPKEKQAEFRKKFLETEQRFIAAELSKSKQDLDRLLEDEKTGKEDYSRQYRISNLKKQIGHLEGRNSYNQQASSDGRSLGDYLNGVKPSRDGQPKTFIFAIGPDLSMDPQSKEVRQEVERMARLIRDRKAGDTVLLDRFTGTETKKAYEDAKKKGNDVVLEVNSHGTNESGTYKVKTEDGWKDGDTLLSSLPSSKGDSASLFTCHAGTCDTKSFQGSLFGLSPAQESGSGINVSRWRQYVQTYPHLGIPSTASDVYSSFSIVNKPIAGPDRWWSSSVIGSVTGMKNTPNREYEGNDSPFRIRENPFRDRENPFRAREIPDNGDAPSLVLPSSGEDK